MRYVHLWNEEEQDRITRMLYRNIGAYCADFLWLGGREPPYTVEHEEHIDACFAQGRGVMVILAHIGNWELLANIFGTRINPLHVLFRPMKNRYVQRWLLHRRAQTGIHPVYQDGALKCIRRALRRNEMVAALIDQRAGRHGTRIPFLSKPANTTRAIAAMCKKSECAVLGAYCILQPDNSYRIVMQRLDRDADRHASADELQLRHNDIVSSWIRAYPSHWFGWFHKRWRGSPEY
jgi:KDO2-lipid IV(A) lauroyltransferase